MNESPTQNTTQQLQDAHRPVLQRWQHLVEHFTAEKTRLESELQYVTEQAKRFDATILAFLTAHYGADPERHVIQIDADKGLVTLHDKAPQVQPESPAA